MSQSHTHSKKFFTDTLKKRFPEYKIQDGEDEPKKQMIDNSKVGSEGREQDPISQDREHWGKQVLGGECCYKSCIQYNFTSKTY